MDKEALGRRIRTQRKASFPPINQTQLAKKAGVSQGTISDYERGRFDSPSAEVILKIAIALRMDPIWLYFAEGIAGPTAEQREQEAALLGMFRELDERGRSMVLTAARSAVETQPKASPSDPFKDASRIVDGVMTQPGTQAEQVRAQLKARHPKRPKSKRTPQSA